MEGISMRPILYPPGTTDFTNLGVGKLRDTISAEVYEARNGAFTLEVEYPVNGVYFDQIKEFSYIKAKPNDRDDYHTFMVYEVAKSTTSRSVIVKATTKTDEIGNTLVTMTNTGNPQSLLNTMKTKALDPITYNMYSDISASKKVDWVRRNPLNAIVGEEGSLVDLFGGELKRTDSTIFLYQRRGNDKVAKFTARRGLKGAKIVVSTASIVTRILPYITILGGAEEEDVTLTGTIVNSPLINNYPVRPLVPVDFGMIDDSIDTIAKLNSKAATYFTSLYPEIDKPKVSVDLDLLSLQDTSDYAQFKAVEKIVLCDTIDVYLPKYDVVRTVKLTELYYDSLREINTRIVAGDKAVSQIDAFKREYSGQVDTIKKHLSKVENTMMVKGDGTQIWSGPDTPPPDKVNINDIWWKKTGEDTWSLLIWNGLIWENMLSDEIFKEIDIRINQAETDIAQNVLDIESTLAKATQAELDAGFATDLAEDAKALGVSATTNANTAMADAQEAVRLAVLNGGRISSAEGSITTIAGQVALKANTTDVNTLTGRVATSEGLITAQAGQIALKANTTDVDTLTGRVSTTESKIVATDGKVITLTTKTDGHTTQIGTLETSYSGLNSTVTALETGKVGNDAFSALEQNLSGFKTTVQNTYADKTTVSELSTQWTTTTNLVNGHTSQIASLGTAINLRATKTEVAESILADKTIKDTRTTNQLPPWYYTNYPKQKAYELKLSTVVGLPASAGTFASVVTEVPWDNASGGPIEQTATATDGVYQRRGSTTWSAWAKVADSSNIISQINISPELILIASRKIQIKGDTYIDNGVIQTAHIADLAVSGAKIANASITSAKIISLDANKVNAITLSAITTNTGTLNVNGWLTTTAENFGFRGTYDYGDNLSGAYNPRWFDGDYRLSHRYLTFQANVYDVTTSNTRGPFINYYTESFYGPDYLKLRQYPSSSSNNTLRNRVDITADKFQITKDWSDASGIILNADGSSFFGERGRFNAGLDIGSTDNVGLRVGRIDAPSHFNTLILNANRDLGTLTLSYDTSRFIKSMDIYNRTYSLAANMYVTPNGILGRATSARKYKSNITTLNSVYSKAKKVLDIRPVTWYDKRALEETGKVQIGYGFIADDFHDTGLVEVVSYGSDGQVEGLAYDHISIYHNVILKDHEQQLKRLDSINSNIIELVANTSNYGLRLNNLETEVFRLKKRIEELEKIA